MASERNARGCCFGKARRESATHRGKQRIGLELRLCAPFFRTPAGVHQHHACAELRANRGHLRIPHEAADIVDDFSACLEGGAGRGGFVGVHGDDRIGALAQNPFENRQKAGLLFLCTDGGAGSGA